MNHWITAVLRTRAVESAGDVVERCSAARGRRGNLKRVGSIGWLAAHHQCPPSSLPACLPCHVTLFWSRTGRRRRPLRASTLPPSSPAAHLISSCSISSGSSSSTAFGFPLADMLGYLFRAAQLDRFTAGPPPAVSMHSHLAFLATSP